MTASIFTLGGSAVTHIFVHGLVALAKNLPVEVRTPCLRPGSARDGQALRCGLYDQSSG